MVNNGNEFAVVFANLFAIICQMNFPPRNFDQPFSLKEGSLITKIIGLSLIDLKRLFLAEYKYVQCTLVIVNA